MSEKMKERLGRIVTEYAEALCAFAGYFLPDREEGCQVAEECIVSCMSLLKKKKAEIEKGEEKVFLYRLVREKCFERLAFSGKKYEMLLAFPEGSEGGNGKAERSLQELFKNFCALEEQEKEILILRKVFAFDFMQIDRIMDRKDTEELYILGLMKLHSLSNENKGKENPAFSDAASLTVLEEKLSLLFQETGKKFPLDKEMEERLLVCAESREPFDYKKALLHLVCLILFCVLTLSIFLYSSYRSRPDLQPEVRVGVRMDQEELKANLLKEKRRQEALKNRIMKKGLSKLTIPAINFEGVRQIKNLDGKKAEKILKERFGLEVTVIRAEFADGKRSKVNLYVSPADSIRILQCRKLIR